MTGMIDAHLSRLDPGNGWYARLRETTIAAAAAIRTIAPPWRGSRIVPLTGIEETVPNIGVVLELEPVVAARPGSRVPFGRKVGYATGQLVELVVGSMLNIFILFYATAVCGLPGALTGIALSVGLVVDAVMDPLIGSLSDGWRSRFGRRVPFMMVGIAPLILTFNLIFALPSTLGTTNLFLLLTALSVTLRISLSIFSLPYQALGVDLTDDYAERSSIAAWRWGIGILGTVAVIFLGYGVFLAGPHGLSRREGYLETTLTLSVPLLVGALSAIRTGLSTRHLERAPTEQAGALSRRLAGEIWEMLRNRTFLIVFGSSVLLNISQGVGQALSMHLGIFFWHITTEQMPALGIAAVLGLALGAPIAARLARSMEKRAMLVTGMLGLTVCQTLPVALRLLGLLPITGGQLVGFLFVIGLLNGLMFALSAIGFISVIPDAADEHEHLFATRREGLYFAGWSFASKAATGAGLLFAGFVLDLIHFPAKVAEQSAATGAISPTTLAWLGIAGGPGAGLIALIGTIIACFYRIDREKHAAIMKDLEIRREH